jgi:Tfp pilus assembly protein PilF
MRRYAIFAVSLIAIGSIPASAHQKPWIEVCSPHFRVLTNGSQNDARHVAKEFEQMRYVFAERYPEFRLEGGAPLTIFAALDEATAKSLEPAIWKSKGVKPAGVFHHGWEKQFALVRIDTMGEDGAREIVYHEYTHSILSLNFHWLPLWLDEGLANFYGYTRFQEHKIYVGAPPARYQMPRGSLIPIETLISADRGSAYYHSEDKVYQFYSESWALVHFLMFDPGMDRGKRLNQFAALLQKGTEQKKAFEQVFGNFKDMDRALENYLAKFAFQTGILPDSTQIEEKSFTTRSMSVAETEAELAGLHLWTLDLAGARPLVKEALKDDPKLGLAHEEMGFLNFSEEKNAEALNEFSQANALDPNLALSLFAKTMLSPIAASSVSADEDALNDAMTKVLALNPQFAPAYVQLARLNLRKNDPATALGLSRKAEELEPSRAGYHVLSGRILLRMGKGTEAAAFARFVARRWPGSDHDEAVELWDAIPVEQRPPGDALFVTVPKDVQSVMGTVKSEACSGPDRNMTFVLSHDGQLFTFRSKGAFPGGFSDTIWYGVDHFSFCHNLEGMRAIVRYRAASDASYAGEIAEIDIRDDPPRPAQQAAILTKP